MGTAVPNKSQAGQKQHPNHAKSETGVLTAEECETVKSNAMAVGLSRVTVRTPQGEGYSRKRKFHSAFLKRNPDTDWLYERIFAKTGEINTEFWRFELDGLQELEVIRYQPGQYFEWHTDVRPGDPRKVTCVVNLSPDKSYWRGGLRVKGTHVGKEIAPLQGAGTWFPSYLPHQATAPWWGKRWVLVAFITGPPWV